MLPLPVVCRGVDRFEVVPMQLPFNARSAGAAIVPIALVSPALAQTAQSRAELLRQAREEKQRTVQPYVPNTFEKTMRLVEAHAIPLLGRDGVGLKLGGLTTGSGFAYGVGLRNSRLADRRGIRPSIFGSAARVTASLTLKTSAHSPHASDGDDAVHIDCKLRDFLTPPRLFSLIVASFDGRAIRRDLLCLAQRSTA